MSAFSTGGCLRPYQYRPWLLYIDDIILAEEKESVIAKFKEGVYPILVSTSVVEVGIDVKEANLMVVYGATHFGLSSLHQLRGRIGRGGDEATCLLVYGGSDEKAF